MKGTEGVPQREDRIVDISGLSLMYLFIHAQITAIHILIGKRGNHRVIESRIEIGQDRGIKCIDLDLVQRLIPLVGRFLPDRFKIPSGQFSCHVLLGSFRIDDRKCHLRIQGSRLFGKLIVELQILIGVDAQEERIGPFHTIDKLIDGLDLLREGNAIGNGMKMSPSLGLDGTLYR